MARKYGKKASEKIGKTMHEWKRGKLKSGGSGTKVTSRKQAIAIGISQARRAGYKTPSPPRDHAVMSTDERVRAHLSWMQPGQEIDADHLALALRINVTTARSALKRAHKAGFAITEDGTWFSPARGTLRHPLAPQGHAMKRKPEATLDDKVRAYLSNMRPGTEIDARGIARALRGGVDPLEADYALERAEKAGHAVTSDGRWFGPVGSRGRSHSKMLSSPVVRVERVKMPNDTTAEIHIHHGKGGYGGVLVLSNGNELPMSLGVPEPKTAAEAVRGAKKFLASVYGRSN